MRYIFSILLTSTLLLGLGIVNVFGGEIPFHNRISYGMYGSTIVTVGTLNASASVFVTSGGPFVYTDISVTDYLSLGIDHELPDYMGDAYDIEVDVFVEPFIGGTPQTAYTQTLKIGYHPFDEESYKDKDILRFTGIDKFDFTITEIRIITGSIITVSPDLPKNVYLDGDIIVDRVGDFTVDAQTGITINSPILLDLDCDIDMLPEEIRINWGTMQTATEYQLEWTFINNYDGTLIGGNPNNPGVLPASQIAYDFRHNSTRISTTSTFYDLPLIFENGYLLYRVRAIGYNPLSPTQAIFGVWSEPIAEGDIGTFTTNNSTAFLYNQMAHEVRKNWQLTTTFAEEGKKKEVISYYDGSLRNRQSVTVVNTDKNVIVGETLYDFQGRPAVNVLPVPVIRPNCTTTSGDQSKAAIKYYPKFNQNTGALEYSRDDFDVDGGTCNTGLAPMSNTSGSSQYYSDQNPNKQNHQAYVPESNGYPFTQVEYTPDNTGRIRRQSGVGPKFQLGSTHETKYFYGKPFQISLDRLFASEVGYAAHYKKNLVVDPNGQVSISYLDQEGRVVATSLAGEAPQNLTGLQSYTDLGTNGTTLDVDVFEKDANGVSTSNVPNVTGDAIVFSQEILVSTAGNYHFTYSLENDPYTEACTPDLCFNCVYDLKLSLTDECGVIMQDINTNLDISYSIMEGYFTKDQSGSFSTFTTDCPVNGTYQSQTYDFTALLGVGNYTITKTLTVNSNAIAYSFNEYITEGQLLGCIDSLGTFIDEEMANIDTSGCNIDCDQCVASLGTLDDFVAQGFGTAQEYELLLEACLAPCNTPSFCETTFEILRADMSPGGQYGEYLNQSTGANAASSFPLSVYNPGNVLPYNSFNTNNINWRFPSVAIDGTTYNYYLDDNGDSAKVFLSLSNPLVIDNTTVIPNVLSNTDIIYDNISNQYYTYPDRIQSVYDFIDEFEYSWSQSLVIYHPEYCYYETCLEYEVEDGNTNSSESFDKLMRSANTFQEAVNKGLIVPAGSSYAIANYSNISSAVYDPFITTGNYGAYGPQLWTSFNSYQIISGQPFTMQDFAAMITRCGNGMLSGSLFTLQSCASSFGDNTGTFSVTNDDEWNVFKGIYLGKKRELQNDYEDDKALNATNNCLNDCIGNDSFNPFTSGMYQSFTWPNFFNNPYYNTANACSYSKRFFYANKTKRFPDQDDLDMNANNASYQYYLQTGQCPNAVNLQNLLGEVAADQQLTATSNDLTAYTGIGILYSNMTGYDYTTPLPTVYWETQLSGTDLTVNVIEPLGGTVNCEISLFSSGQISNWNDVVSFSGLNSLGFNAGTGLYEFDIVATLLNGNHITLTGATCMDLENCTFDPVCDANDLALSVENVITLLASENKFVGATSYNFGTITPYPSMVNTQLLNVLNATNASSLSWLFTGTSNVAKITNGANELQLIFSNYTPGSYNSIAYFDNIQSEFQHYFSMDGYDLFGNLLVQIEGEALFTNDGGATFTPIAMGDCELPTPIECNENEHELLINLEDLLGDVLVSENYNIFQSNELTSLMTSYLGTSTSSSGATSSTTSNGVTTENLTISMPDCDIEMAFETTSGVLFSDIIAMGPITATGPSINNNYYDFEFTATTNSGGSTVLITGTSCMPLKNCDLCDTNIITVPTPDSVIVIEGKGRIIVSNTKLALLETAVDSLNNRMGFFPSTSQYVVAPSLEYCITNNLDYFFDTYIFFIDNYDPTIDDSTLLYDMNKFCSVYGYTFNVDFEYQRYQRAVTSYNGRAQLASVGTINPISRDAFVENRLAYHSNNYINYLRTQPAQNSTTTAIDAITFFTNTGVIDPTAPQTACKILYEDYVTAYNYFFANSTLSPQELKLCLEMHPMVSFEDFDKNNLCCNSTGTALLTNYISSFYSLPTCPEAFPSLKDCNSSTVDLGKVCQFYYELYLDEVKKYNASVFAQVIGHQLIALDPGKFLAAGYCKCINEYLKYLETFIILPANSPQSAALNLNEFSACQSGEGLTTECEDKYNEYIHAIAAYNNYVKQNGLSWPFINVVFNFNQFTTQGLCNCSDGYVAYLNALVSGTLQDRPTDKDLSIEMYCPQAPCAPESAPVQDTVSPIVVNYINPCIQQALNIANLNAEIAYQNYLNGLSTAFTQNMQNHCLNVNEKMNLDFNEKEYHYTLYYYDQSGNLIKTVPPEGIEIVATTSSTDAVSTAINLDRTNQAQSVFTFHRLETKYMYNSLNQLTKQSLPDHDQMDIFEFSLPNGLDSKLRILSTQFVTETRGYLAGFVNYSGNQRGMLYQTNNGGNTWIKVENTLGSNLQSVQWISNTTAYAVGTEGILIQTTDGGFTWDLLDTYNDNITSQLNDLYVDNTGNGIVVGNNGTIASVNGTTISSISPIVSNTAYSLNNDDHITSIEFVGGNYYITVDFQPTTGDRFGLMYRSSNGTNWDALEKVKLENLTHVQAIDVSNYIAIGPNGTYVKSIDGGNNWYVQTVQSKEVFTDIYFSSLTEGIAIRENGLVYATYDAGANWSLLDPFLSYNAFYPYETTKVLAVGDNGQVGRIIMTPSTPFGIVQHTTNFSTNLTNGWAGVVGANTVIMVISGSGTIHYTLNANSSSPVWSTYTTTIGSISKIEGNVFGGVVRGIITDNSGVLYGYEANGSVFVNNTITATANYTTIGKNGFNNQFIAYDANGGTLDELSGTSGIPSTINNLTTLTAGTTFDDVSIDPSGNNYLLVNNTGEISKSTVVGASFTNVNQTLQVRPLVIADATMVANTFTSVGNNGTLIRLDLTTATNDESEIKTTLDADNYNAIDGQTTTGILVGDNGLAYKVGAGGVLTSITTSITEDILSVGLDANSTSAYYGGESGQLYRSSDYTLPAPAFIVTNSTSNKAVNAISIAPNSTVSYVGNNSSVYQGTASMAYQIKSIYTPQLRDVHFSSPNNGYVVGRNYTVRYTNDGGTNWKTILPSNGFTSGNVTEVFAVHTKSNSEAQLIGRQKYIATSNNTIATPITAIPTAGNYPLHDITYTDANNGLVVGGTGGTNGGKAWRTTNGGVSWSLISLPGGTSKLRGIHGFPRNDTYVTVGNGGRIVYITSSSAINFPSGTTENLYDVYFHDDINGYAVGNNGTLLKSTGGTINASTGLITGLPWVIKSTADNFSPFNKNIRTIDFSSRYVGFLGGFNTAGPSATRNYARLLKDESEEFSTYFWYDKLGRIVVSQNSKQYNAPTIGAGPRRYSYTLYDVLGRVIEAGEKVENTDPNTPFQSIFGTYVSGLYNPSVVDDGKLNDWITHTTGQRQEVTHSYYDRGLTALGITAPVGFVQDEPNMRKRISAVTFEKVYDITNNVDTYSYATFYDYDIHGNVKTLIQDNKELGANPNPDVAALQYKRMDYTYDLISGNVHQVSYQDGEADAWHHKYDYDGDNRILSAETSSDKVTWDRDAAYIYYDHGPLARTECGDLNVQGTDYAYTLQGWLKGVNSDLLNPNNDMGQDGIANGTNPNALFARDAMGFSLTYYEDDYSPIDYVNKWQQHSNRFAAPLRIDASTQSDVLANRNDLFNGNIGAMVTTITKPQLYASTGIIMPDIMPQATAYYYDQLNRISQARAYQNIDVNITNINPDNTINTYNEWGFTGTYDDKYYNDFVYDASGNITHQNRHDHLGNLIEDLDYHYATDGVGGALLQNRLYSVTENDAVNNALYDDDIEDMAFIYAPIATINDGSQNYKYDAIGQLVQDRQEEIFRIDWRVDNKIRAIIREEGSDKKNIVFDYDPLGNRIAKHIYGNQSFTTGSGTNFDPNTPIDWEKTTYYNRDAQGNVMVVYDYEVDNTNNVTNFTMVERNIYGSSRVGMNRDCLEMIAATTNTTSFSHTLGLKQYECTNHLGNVLSVITDRKIPRDDDGDTFIDYYQPEITKATDYSPFGVELYERNFTRQEVTTISTEEQLTLIDNDDFSLIANGGVYNIGDQGNNWNHFFGTGSVTSLEEYLIDSQPFGFFGSVILAQKDWSGLLTVGDNYRISFDITDINGIVTLFGPQGAPLTYTSTGPQTIDFTAVTNNGSFVLFSVFGSLPTDVTIDNVKLEKVEVITETCTIPVGAYRYGFSGQEKDDEIKGEGNSLNFKYRMVDVRLGRFFAVDPLSDKYPYMSTYQFAGNKPVWSREIEGLESEVDAQVGVQINIGNSGNSSVKAFAGLNLTTNTSGSTQGNFGVGLSLYSGGIGTNQGTTGSSSFNLDLNFSAGTTFGGGTGTPMQINNYYQGSGISMQNSFQNSFSIGGVGTLSSNSFSQSGRNQVSGYLGTKMGSFTASTYNDIFSGPLNNDSYWTGGFETKFQLNANTNLSLTYDGFTGARPKQDEFGNYESYSLGGFNYYGKQGSPENSFNNGQTMLKLSNTNFSFGVGHIGNGALNGQWLQNAIHDNWPFGGAINRFENTSKESIIFQGGAGSGL